MERNAITVPCAGDKNYTRALKTVAARNGLRMADIVRSALDNSEYATEIEREMTSFFATDAVRAPHTTPDTAKESA